MTDCVKFPSIDQFRNAVKNIKNQASFDGIGEDGKAKFKTVVYPALVFFGTVKAHGTNAAIRQDVLDGEIIYQSRERVITPVDDNAGFAAHFYQFEKEVFRNKFFWDVRNLFDVADDVPVVIYGEWAGGNIQSGVAINGLPKMFLVFAVRIGTETNTKWIRPDDERMGFFNIDMFQMHNIAKFGMYRVIVDLNNPEYAQNEIVKMVEAVEAECPIGKYFGNSGVGEGIVFMAHDDQFKNNSIFKAKGEKHSASKVRTTASVDIERVESLKALVDTIVTENRLNQMVGVMKDKEGLDVDLKNTGVFIKTVMDDCMKEELDTILGNGFNTKEFAGQAGTKIRQFWLNLYNTSVL